MINGSLKTLPLILWFFLAFGAFEEQSEPDLIDPAAQQKLAKSFVDNFNSATPIDPIRAGKISEDVAYSIADVYVAELMKQEGDIAGYKIGTFAAEFTMTNETGEILAEGRISDAYDPIYRVRHLRDQLLKRGRMLKPGDILSLGDMGAIRPLKPNDFMDPATRPVFRGNVATVSYIGLDPAGPALVSVIIDR